MKKYIYLLILLSAAFAQINYENDIQPIFNTNCVTCHNTGSTNYNQHLLDLSSGNSYGNLYNVTSTGYAPGSRVVPYNAESSVIYHKMSDSGVFGGVMPPTGELASSTVNLITDWINGGAFLGTGGRIGGRVILTEDHPFGQVQIILYLPGGGILEQQWGETPPFDINYFFEDPAITEGGPYRVESSFDLNDNNQYDDGEPYYTTGDLYLSDSNVLENIDLQLASGGASDEYSYDFEMGSPVRVFEGTGANDLGGAVDFSIEFWIMFHANPGTDQTLFERLEPAGVGNDMELKWNNSNQQFILSLGGPPGTQFGELIAGGMNPFDGNWHHIYIQYLSVTNRLEFFWEAGLASYTEPSDVSPAIANSDNPLRFGTDLAASVDEIRIRTISENYGQSFVLPTAPYVPADVDANIIVLWHCNEDGGTELIDDGFYKNNIGVIEESGSWDGSNPWGGGSEIGLWYTGFSSNHVDWEWNRWPDADGDFQKYELRRQVNNPGVTESSPSVYVETDVNVVNWRDNDITEGNNYYYKLYMYDQSSARYETGELMFTPSGGGASGKIECDVHVNRAISGNIYLELYYPGNNPNSGSPDEELTPQFVNLADDGHWPLQFINMPDGNGYSVVSFIDAQGSPNSGSVTCDDGTDLMGMTENINITGGSIENISVEMAECSAGADYPDISNFSITSGDAYTDGLDDVEISVELDASSGISEAKLIYYLGGSYSSKPESALVEDAGVWTGIIPAGEVTMEGLMVQVYAISNNGYESTSEWVEIPVFFNSYGFSGLMDEQYVMVSFPGDLDIVNVKNVLENTLGSYDPAQWRSFRYNNNTNAYDENTGNFTPGNAFWVISREAGVLTGGSGEVTSLQEDPYTITLNLGWNMIGNPYGFILDFPAQMIFDGSIDSTLWGFDGSGYYEAPSLEPGEGYWLYAYDADAQIEFTYLPQSVLPKLSTGGWTMNLSASILGYEDSENKIGAHPLALDERDGLDAHEPPVIGPYVQLTYRHDDWKDSGNYSKDIRHEGSAEYRWDMTVKSNLSGQIILKALDVNSIPNDFDAVLVDLDNKLQYNLRSGETYKYISLGNEQNHYFQVIIGLPERVSKSIDELGLLPSRFAVGQNAPNPFNPITAIRLQLADDAIVTMTIFNIRGEEVKTLIQNEFMEIGYRQITWNGRDNANRSLPSGLYLYRTIIKNTQGQLVHVNTKKMLMVK